MPKTNHHSLSLSSIFFLLLLCSFPTLHAQQLAVKTNGLMLAAICLLYTSYYPDATGSEPYITTFSYDLKDAVYNKDENGAYLSSGFMGGREYNISAYIYLSLIHI